MKEGDIHIHAPLPIEHKIKRSECPDCKKNSYFVTFYYEWYGLESTCMRCGRQFNEDGGQDLLFYRYARRDNKNSVRKFWKSLNNRTG